MNSAEYAENVEALYDSIEEMLDRLIEDDDAPIDYENSSGVITIDCEDSDTKVIVSRQQASQQVWVAAKSGGFHCVYDDQASLWRCTKTQESLEALLSRVCSEQLDTPIAFAGLDEATL